MSALSPTTSKYLLSALYYAHKTFVYPLIWDQKTKCFFLEASKTFEQNAKLLILSDIILCSAVLVVAILTRVFNGSFLFLLIVSFVWTVTFMNSIVDFCTLSNRIECLQLLNGFLQFLNALNSKIQNNFQ